MNVNILMDVVAEPNLGTTFMGVTGIAIAVFAAVVIAPKGKPITVHTGILPPSSCTAYSI